MYGKKPQFTQTYSIAASGSQTITDRSMAGASEFHFSVTGAGLVTLSVLRGSDATYLDEATIAGGTGSVIMDALWVTGLRITETSGSAVTVTVAWG